MTQKGPPPATYDRPTVDLEPLFSAAGHLTGIDPMLLKAIAMQESSLNPSHWNSSSHAVGLMELEPQNWKSLGVTDPWDPAQNIMGGARFLSDNLKMYDGDLSKALQQYNGGNPHRWGTATRAYVQHVLNNYQTLTGTQAPDVLPQFIQAPLPPVLRPDPASPVPLHLNMNSEPRGQTNFAQSQPDPQLAFAPTTRGAVPSPLPSRLPPSPFVQALLTNAIFGAGSPANPFAMGAGVRPGGTGGR